MAEKNKDDVFGIRNRDYDKFKPMVNSCGAWAGAELYILRQMVETGQMTNLEGLFVAQLQNQRILLEILDELKKKRVEMISVN